MVIKTTSKGKIKSGATPLLFSDFPDVHFDNYMHLKNYFSVPQINHDTQVLSEAKAH